MGYTGHISIEDKAEIDAEMQWVQDFQLYWSRIVLTPNHYELLNFVAYHERFVDTDIQYIYVEKDQLNKYKTATYFPFKWNGYYLVIEDEEEAYTYLEWLKQWPSLMR